jgi:nucleoside-diphosphate-sugar epimerase
MAAAPRHVLIAGCGYLGRRAADAWRQGGTVVSVITRSEAKAGELEAAGFDPMIADLGSPYLPGLPNVDTVLWSVGFDRSAASTRQEVWIGGLTRLVEHLPSSATRFLYVSSTGVYGESSGEEVDETTAAEPTTESGRCCLQAEQLLSHTFRESSVDLTVLRMAGLYGPDRLLRRVADLRAATPLSGQPDSFLNLIHIDDAVTAVAELATGGSIPLINVVNTGTLTREEYYSAVARLVDAPTPVFDPAAVPARGGNKRVISSVRASLDLTYRFDDVRTGLRDAVSRSADL